MSLSDCAVCSESNSNSQFCVQYVRIRSEYLSSFPRICQNLQNTFQKQITGWCMLWHIIAYKYSKQGWFISGLSWFYGQMNINVFSHIVVMHLPSNNKKSFLLSIASFVVLASTFEFIALQCVCKYFCDVAIDNIFHPNCAIWSSRHKTGDAKM